MSQTFPAAAVDSDNNVYNLLSSGAAAYPLTAAFPTVTISPLRVISFSTGAGVNGNVVDSYVDFSWTSLAGGGVVTDGAQLVVGQTLRNLRGTNSILRALVKVNNAVRISEVYLSAIDTINGANNFQSANLAGAVGVAWNQLQSAAFNAAAWSPAMAISLTVLGTATAANVGATTLDIAWLDYTP